MGDPSYRPATLGRLVCMERGRGRLSHPPHSAIRVPPSSGGNVTSESAQRTPGYSSDRGLTRRRKRLVRCTVSKLNRKSEPGRIRAQHWGSVDSTLRRWGDAWKPVGLGEPAVRGAVRPNLAAAPGRPLLSPNPKEGPRPRGVQQHWASSLSSPGPAGPSPSLAGALRGRTSPLTTQVLGA